MEPFPQCGNREARIRLGLPGGDHAPSARGRCVVMSRVYNRQIEKPEAERTGSDSDSEAIDSLFSSKALYAWVLVGQCRLDQVF